MTFLREETAPMGEWEEWRMFVVVVVVVVGVACWRAAATVVRSGCDVLAVGKVEA